MPFIEITPEEIAALKPMCKDPEHDPPMYPDPWSSVYGNGETKKWLCPGCGHAIILRA